MPSGSELRKSGPIGRAPATGMSGSPSGYAGINNTVAHPLPAHNAGTNSQTKDMGAYKGGQATADKSGGAS